MSGECTSSSPSDDPAGQRCRGPTQEQRSEGPLRIAIVGICGAGKSTLAAGLRARGFAARQISQEHSGVSRLWRRFWDPDVLVYLDASDRVVEARLGRHDHGEIAARQRERLALARQECDIYVDTDPLTPAQVLDYVLAYLPRLAVP